MNNITLICYIGSIKVTNIDQFRCGLMNFAETLYLNNFNYICMSLTALIMLISIFGKIQGNYHWFILHQAFWDFMVSYDAFCNGWGMSLLLKVQQPKCFYSYNATQGVYSPLQTLSYTVIDFIQTAPFAALTLLPASRFLALYYFKLYEKLTKRWRIIFVIIIFNFILAIFYSGRFYTTFLTASKLAELTKICLPYTPNFNATCYSQISIEVDQTSSNLQQIVHPIILFLPTLYLFFTIIFAILIVLRILKQAKFQQKHNKKDFYNSLRIAGVIVLQASINVFALFTVSIPTFMQTVAPSVFIQFPVWLRGSYGLFQLTPRYMISQIRVFLDAFIVLILMTGYREAIVNFLKTVFFALKNPRKAFQKSRSYFRRDTSVTNQWF